MPTEAQRREIREAIAAADVALEHLESAADQLNRAGGWGIVDMLGGSIFTSLIKQGHISDAQDEIDEAKEALRAFARELRDVDASAGLNVEVGRFLGFADVFLDGIIADWLVQSKIDRAKQQVADAIRQVEFARGQLVRLL